MNLLRQHDNSRSTANLRRKVVLSLLLICAFGTIALSQNTTAHKSMKVTGAKNYAPYQKIVLKASDYSNPKGSFLWQTPKGTETEAIGDTLYVWAPPGSYKVVLTYIDFDAKKAEQAEIEFTVGDGPTPDPGPTPGPGPKPPDPKPEPVTSRRALIMVESLANAPKEELVTLNSLKVRDYLDKKCTDGRKGWRKWDQHVPKDKDNAVLVQLWEDCKGKVGKLPVLILTQNNKADVYPLPATEAATLELLKKWGGD